MTFVRVDLKPRRQYRKTVDKPKVRAAAMVGQTFGRLTVMFASDLDPGTIACLCACGASWVGPARRVYNGGTRSCGCALRETTVARCTKHGLHKTAEYEAWRGMIRRCCRPNCISFKNYGGRGITVCDRWRFGEGGLSGLQCFIADMGTKPRPELSIDRIDNEGDYEPANCRWVGRCQQARNSRPGYRFGTPLRRQMERPEVARLARQPVVARTA
jgi:hypothetical protein